MFRRKRVLRSALVSCLLLAACGNRAETATPTATGDSSASTSSASTPAESGSAAPSAAESARKRRPFELYNSCTDVVTIAFGDDPKAPTAGRKTVAPSSAIEGPRDGEGNQTVWLLDGAGEGLVKVRVTRGMKRVEVGRSCRTLDSR
jgi:hypothetical protein